MNQENIRVKDISQRDARTLEILWTDDARNEFDVVDLRRMCPCASCVDEWTHEPILKPESVSDAVRPIRVDSVGQYALTVHFNDGHRTGIYTFQYLRNIASRKLENQKSVH